MINYKSQFIILLQTGLALFALLFILFIPFPFYIFPFQQAISNVIFKDCISFIARYILDVIPASPEISSDSMFMYILAGVLFCVSFAGALLFRFVKNNFRQSFFTISHKLFCYYLALQLLKYGFDKVFKCQFYMPEPNILYTPLGHLDKDILYWSSMGTSYTYNVFTGGAEILAAILILFRKTRVLGLLMAAAVMLNVVAINFSFDISVKVYSVFLLFLALLLLSPQFGSLFRFFVLQQAISPKSGPSLFSPVKRRLATITLKAFVISIVFIEALYPYVKTGNFNDDMAQRPFLHGAYEVMQAVQLNDTSVIAPPLIKKFFIHREGFIIFQDQQDEMQDFKLYIDQAAHQFVLTDYDLNQTKHNFWWHKGDSLLEFQYVNNNTEYLLKAKALDWKKLPALQKRFHWTVEGVE